MPTSYAYLLPLLLHQIRTPHSSTEGLLTLHSIPSVLQEKHTTLSPGHKLYPRGSTQVRDE